MRNYPPTDNATPPTPLPYFFSDLMLRFTATELATYLRAEADKLEAQVKTRDAGIAAKVEAELRTYFPKQESLTPEMLAEAVASIIDAAPVRATTKQTVERLRFCAEHLPQDSTFEFTARQLFDLVDTHLVQGRLSGLEMGRFSGEEYASRSSSLKADSIERLVGELKTVADGASKTVGGNRPKLALLKDWMPADLRAQMKEALAEQRLSSIEHPAPDVG